MRTHPLLALTGAFFTLVFLAASASAQSGKKAAPAPKPGTFQGAVTQVDGITTRVVDNLWVQTDRYWHDGDYNRIVGLIRLITEAEPSFGEAYSNGAYLLWSMGDTAAADRMLKKGIANTPGKWDLPYEFGWHLFNTKRYADAIPYLKTATQYKNATFQPYTALAHSYDRTGKLEDSVKTWREIVRKFPNYSAGPPNLARVEAKLRSQNQGANR